MRWWRNNTSGCDDDIDPRGIMGNKLEQMVRGREINRLSTPNNQVWLNNSQSVDSTEEMAVEDGLDVVCLKMNEQLEYIEV